MPIHQLELNRRANETTDDERVVHLLRGRMTLREALGIDEKLIAAYRKQAELLFAAKKWRSAADVVEGLIALDAAGTGDVMMLVRSYEELGEHDRAAHVGALLHHVLSQNEERAHVEVSR